MFDLITNRDSNVKNDVLSGITVALALVPEAVAFAFVAGVEPMIGLYAAFMMGLITHYFMRASGRRYSLGISKNLLEIYANVYCSHFAIFYRRIIYLQSIWHANDGSR